MTGQHAIQSQRDPMEWAQLYARSYGVLASLVESVLDGTLLLDELEALYRTHAKQHYDEVRGEVRAVQSYDDLKPPE